MTEPSGEIPVTNETPKSPTEVTRRNFLKLAVGATLTAPLVLKEIERAVYAGIQAGLTTPGATEKIISAALKISEKAPDSENPNYRPMADIIKEGISVYSENSNRPVVFQRHEEYKDVDYYSKIVGKFPSKQILPQAPGKVVTEIIDSFPPETREAFEQSSSIATGFELLFTPGSGFSARFRKKHPEFAYKDGEFLPRLSYEKFRLMDEDGRSEMEEMRRWVEEKRSERGEPISASFILSRFLEKNAGNVPHSIFDTALFLKFMARTDLESGSSSADKFNVQWYRQNIKDEYQGPLYSSPPEGEPAVNLIGKPYHSWNLVALLPFLPPELVQIGGLQRQLSHFREQGLGKTRADLQTLKDLRQTEELLLKYMPASTG